MMGALVLFSGSCCRGPGQRFCPRVHCTESTAYLKRTVELNLWPQAVAKARRKIRYDPEILRLSPFSSPHHPNMRRARRLSNQIQAYVRMLLLTSFFLVQPRLYIARATR